MPADDRPPKLKGFPAEFHQSAQTRGQFRPFVGNKRQQKATAARGPEFCNRHEQLLDRQVVLLEIDTAKTVDLQVHQRGRDPKIVRRLAPDSAQGLNDTSAQARLDRPAGGVMPGVNFAVLHGTISVSSLPAGKQNNLVFDLADSPIFWQKDTTLWKSLFAPTWMPRLCWSRA
jgi:hypothetical protein